MKNKFCLLVDDDPIINIVHKDVILSIDSDTEIIIAMTGEEGLSVLKNVSAIPHILFLDINMPIMNGFEFLDRILEEMPEIGVKMKVILLTSSVNPRDIERSKKYDCVIDYISKPLTRAYLNSQITDD